jgi:DNA repair protein recO
MYGTVEVLGMVIKTMNIGEYDRRITILTKDKGKLSAFVRGARRPNNHFTGTTNLFCFGTFVLYEGRDSYNLQSANISKYFSEISSDMENTCYASYFLEIADYYSKEHLREPELLKLVYAALLALNKDGMDNKLVRRVFELRAMVIGGEYDSVLSEASDDCLYTWNFIVNTPIENLFKFKLSEELMNELALNVDKNIEKYIDRKMNSLEILQVICE